MDFKRAQQLTAKTFKDSIVATHFSANEGTKWSTFSSANQAAVE